MRSFALPTSAFLAAMVLSIASAARALEVAPIIKAVGSAPSNFFSGGPISGAPQTVANNRVLRFTVNPGPTGGGGFTIPISNGENGRSVTAGRGPVNAAEEYRPAYASTYGFADGVNHDLDNPTPVGLAIAAVNNGGRIQNGNAFRFSVWIKHDLANPVNSELAVEPILKFELWSDAQSTYADYDGTKLAPEFGDRLWDTDINGRNGYFAPFEPSVSTVLDLNNDGDVPSGVTPVTSVPVVDDWLLVETTIVINDHPDGLDPTRGWEIGGTQYFVDAIEEIRATFFLGDFSDNSMLLTNGSIYVDNALMEIFPDEAAMAATPNPNTKPVGLAGDLNFDEQVNGTDFLVWQRGLGLLYNATDLNNIRTNFGAGGSAEPALNASVLAYVSAVPEPATGVLALGGLLGLGRLRRRIGG